MRPPEIAKYGGNLKTHGSWLATPVCLVGLGRLVQQGSQLSANPPVLPLVPQPSFSKACDPRSFSSNANF